MAFKDQNGKITIDEVAAQNDIKKLMSSIEHLENSIEKLDEMYYLAESLQGKTSETIKSTCLAMKKQINASIEQDKLAIEDIRNTISKYQKIDASLKGVIDGSF